MVANEYFIFDKPLYGGMRKKIIREIKAAFYKFFLNTIKCKQCNKKYNVSVCAIFKNEADYLKEWVEFNHLVGIDHFYLYNNNSVDNYSDVLRQYIEMGLVTLMEWPYNQKQMECYMDCINKYASESKWLGFIDIDEFIVPKATTNLYDYLKPYEKNRGSVMVYWRLYGSGGLIDRRSDSLVTEDFTVCWPKYCDIGKCFYNTAFSFNHNSLQAKQLHHRFWANWKGINIPPVNVFDHVCFEDRNIVDSKDFPIQINHYFTKSYVEYAKKKSKGDVYFADNPHDEDYFFEHEMNCTSTDYSAYRYLVKLKMIMDKTEKW